jgi:L-ascorbate metabolism protein UlaG (beta-lactamase superfamily)
MFSFGRLNADATWWCTFAGTRVLFDPWLTGSEIDGFAAFHQARPTAARLRMRRP